MVDGRSVIHPTRIRDPDKPGCSSPSVSKRLALRRLIVLALQYIARQGLVFVEFKHAEQVALAVQPAAGLVERGSQGHLTPSELLLLAGPPSVFANQGH